MTGYWRSLASSANFPGLSLKDCLGVIHTDIVQVWNFSDKDFKVSEILICRSLPSTYAFIECLISTPCQAMISNIVGDLDAQQKAKGSKCV